MDIIQQLELLADKLGDVVDEIMIVGGCSPALILNIDTIPDLRPTYDIDIVIQAESFGKYMGFIQKIKKKGFEERPGDPIGRYASGEIVVDVIPTDSCVLGFSNRWYKKAFDNPIMKRLPSGRVLKTITPVFFVAAKLEAFRSRGLEDLMASADLEDLITVLVEYPSFQKEFREGDRDVQEYIGGEFKKLISDESYPHFLSAHLRGDEASQASLAKLRQLLEGIASEKI
ncbi:MAG: hypothetical protein NTX30_21225 [Deltaproteobacteria bacterium]|nr:hypothetical protein [Deltaproteobacteria bacterium]